MTFGPMIEQYNFENSGKDDTMLERLVVMTFCGLEGYTTREVYGYNSCYNKNQGTGTVYHQQRRYFFTKEKDLTCPRTRFRDNLADQLEKWRADSGCILVCLNANKHIYQKV